MTLTQVNLSGVPPQQRDDPLIPPTDSFHPALMEDPYPPGLAWLSCPQDMGLSSADAKVSSAVQSIAPQNHTGLDGARIKARNVVWRE
jgi:hypothetical protein